MITHDFTERIGKGEVSWAQMRGLIERASELHGGMRRLLYKFAKNQRGHHGRVNPLVRLHNRMAGVRPLRPGDVNFGRQRYFRHRMGGMTAHNALAVARREAALPVLDWEYVGSGNGEDGPIKVATLVRDGVTLRIALYVDDHGDPLEGVAVIVDGKIRPDENFDEAAEYAAYRKLGMARAVAADAVREQVRGIVAFAEQVQRGDVAAFAVVVSALVAGAEVAREACGGIDAERDDDFRLLDVIGECIDAALATAGEWLAGGNYAI